MCCRIHSDQPFTNYTTLEGSRAKVMPTDNLIKS